MNVKRDYSDRLLAALVACAGPLVHCLLQPFAQDGAASASAYAIAHLAYLGLLLNLFRQIHGLAIVVADNEYHTEVGQYLTLGGHIASLVGLVLVLALPALLLAILCSNNAVPLNFLVDYLGISASKHGIQVIIFFLASTALAYLIWDAISASQSSSNGLETRIRPWRPCVTAVGYREFLHNWIVLCIYALILTIPTFFLAIGLATRAGTPLVPAVVGGKALLLVLLILTYGYSITDYYVNRHFYFRYQTLAQRDITESCGFEQ